MRCRVCPFFCYEITFLFGAQIPTLKAARRQTTDSKHSRRTVPTCCKLSATTRMIPARSDCTVTWQCLQVLCRWARCMLSHQHWTHSRPLVHHLTLEHFTTMVPATISYTVLLCWKNRSVMKAGKKKAMEKFLFKARTVDLQREMVRVITTDKRRRKQGQDWEGKILTQIKRHSLLALQAPCWVEPGPKSRMWQLGVQWETSLEWLLLLPKCKWPECRNGDEVVIGKEAAEPKHTAGCRILQETHLIKTH